jgi:F0F1-type ATP synthase delta subunit
MEFSMDSNEQIRQRALVGLFFSLYIYNSRLEFYPELLEEIEELKAIPDIETNIEFIAIQLLKTKETEKISKKLNEEIYP